MEITETAVQKVQELETLREEQINLNNQLEINRTKQRELSKDILNASSVSNGVVPTKKGYAVINISSKSIEFYTETKITKD